MINTFENTISKGNLIQAVIFDLGDTLIYFDSNWSETFTRADQELYRSLSAAGVEVDRDEFLERYHTQIMTYYQERDTEFIEHTTQFILQNVLEQLGARDVPLETIRASLVDMYAVFQAHWHTEVESIPVLEELKSQGYRLGLVSNASDDANVQLLVDKAGIRSYFDHIITSAGMGIRKPSPKIFLPLLHNWSLPAERVVMVGDTLGADILGARNAGMHSVWVTRRADNAGNRANIGMISPDITVSNLAEIPAAIKKLTAAPG